MIVPAYAVAQVSHGRGVGGWELARASEIQERRDLFLDRSFQLLNLVPEHFLDAMLGHENRRDRHV